MKISVDHRVYVEMFGMEVRRLLAFIMWQKESLAGMALGGYYDFMGRYQASWRGKKK